MSDPRASACICIKSFLACFLACRTPPRGSPNTRVSRTSNPCTITAHHARRPQLHATPNPHAPIRASHGVGSAVVPAWRLRQKAHAPILPTAAAIRHDHGVTPPTKAYVGHMALPGDPAVINALIRNSTDAPTLLHKPGHEMLDAATPRDRRGIRGRSRAFREFETSARRSPGSAPDHRRTSRQPFERTTMSNEAVQAKRSGYRCVGSDPAVQASRLGYR